MMYFYKNCPSPLGDIKVIISDKKVLALLWKGQRHPFFPPSQLVEKKNLPLLKEVERQLKEYFKNKRTTFDLPLEFLVGTLFQKKVWKVLKKIPFSKTWTYKDVAEKIKHPTAYRACGAAIGKNPLSILIPCHRVIGQKGKLVGFAGGLSRKSQLLQLEQR